MQAQLGRAQSASVQVQLLARQALQVHSRTAQDQSALHLPVFLLDNHIVKGRSRVTPAWAQTVYSAPVLVLVLVPVLVLVLVPPHWVQKQKASVLVPVLQAQPALSWLAAYLVHLACRLFHLLHLVYRVRGQTNPRGVPAQASSWDRVRHYRVRVAYGNAD